MSTGLTYARVQHSLDRLKLHFRTTPFERKLAVAHGATRALVQQLLWFADHSSSAV
jgi:hypothetical protein